MLRVKPVSNFKLIAFVIGVSAFLCFYTLPLQAMYTDTQWWTSFSLRKNIAEQPWFVSLDGDLRYSQGKATSVVNGAKLWGGYKHEMGTEFMLGFEERSTEVDRNDERRLMAQAIHRWNFDPAMLQLRVRHEFRHFHQDKQEWMQRSRIMTRVEATQLKFWIVTPYIAPEYMYIMNSVGSRRAGTVEFRGTSGLSFAAAKDFKVDLAYMNRRIFVPGKYGAHTKESLYHVILLAGSYRF